MSADSLKRTGEVVPPGGTIGILGGGQLGRMTAMAAARLGYRVHVFTPEADGPCAQVCAAETVAEKGKTLRWCRPIGNHPSFRRYLRFVH